MNIVICDTYDEMSEMAAEMIAKHISGRKCVLGLATGSTPEGMYRHLIKLCKDKQCDFSKTVTFNLDEYYPISPDNPQSYRYYMNNKLFNHVNIDFRNTNVPDGESENAERDCDIYESKIANAGGIDIQVLGMGVNGHIGFNEPDDELIAKTHKTMLSDSTLEANSRFFDNIDTMPKMALTMGMKTILSARKILILVNGLSKHSALQKLIDGVISTQWPISFLNLHSDVTLICDREAYYGNNAQ